ncbi:uncharacterized protein DS421_14g465600 [Arachis hypogaea]|nr:uncharacterized protein DS421_14g465600 [Arachis hypogaea]
MATEDGDKMTAAEHMQEAARLRRGLRTARGLGDSPDCDARRLEEMTATDGDRQRRQDDDHRARGRSGTPATCDCEQIEDLEETPLIAMHEDSRRQAPDCDGRRQRRILLAVVVAARVFPLVKAGRVCSKEYGRRWIRRVLASLISP